VRIQTTHNSGAHTQILDGLVGFVKIYLTKIANSAVDGSKSRQALELENEVENILNCTPRVKQFPLQGAVEKVGPRLSFIPSFGAIVKEG